MSRADKPRRVLIIVENLPSPFDRRVWQEATTLHDAGYEVNIICPTGKGYESHYEVIDGIHIYRHELPLEGDGALGYLMEYSAALFHEFRLAFKVFFTRGFDVIHACNPPDLIFLVGGFFKIFLGKKFLFDHHDINPELYEAKFGRRDFFYKLMVLFERWTFKTASVSIATNESFKRIAVERGGMAPEKVYVVRSGPKLERLRVQPPVPKYKNGRQFMIGYIGVMGKQDGIDYLLRTMAHIVFELKRHDIQMVLLGFGTELEPMKIYSQELGLSDYVTFTGKAQDPLILDVLNTADVCVAPDVANAMNDKSTMNKIMEYMALAKPIVQFDLTEGRFSAQEASLYARANDEVDMAEKILELLADPARCKVMGEYGQRRVMNELEWKYEAPKLLAAYDALFASETAKSSLPTAVKEAVRPD